MLSPTTKLDNLTIGSQTLPLNALRVEYHDRKPEDCKSRREVNWATRVVLPDGRRLYVSDRFWLSFSSLFGLSQSVFSYWQPEEVFQRITEVKGDTVRVAFEEIQGSDVTDGRLLSCTKPDKPLLRVNQTRRLVEQFGGRGLSYGNGIVTARFDCPFPMEFEIGGDGFRTQFHMEMPLDGYGLPSAYLALLRLVCSNGMVGVSPAFKTTFQLGKNERDLDVVLRRAFQTFNDEEGFHSFRQRVESATRSWASLHEALGLRKILSRVTTGQNTAESDSNEILQKFDNFCGNPLGFYGLSGQEELSARKAKSIPVRTTMYDLMNYASEAATHHLHRRVARDRVNAWIGGKVTGEYDLEGTVDVFPEYRDYFLQNPALAETPQSAADIDAAADPGVDVRT